MSDATKIEWTDATWNPITGCSVVSPGCTNCYAMRLAGTRMKHHPSRAGLTQASKAGPVWNGEVRLNEGWLDQPLRWKRPRMIFVCAHGDLFHESVPDDWIDRVFAVMALSPQHTFQVLTKRAERMREYFAGNGAYLRVLGDGVERELRNAGIRWHGDNVDRHSQAIAGATRWPLPNVWLGISAEDQARADERIPYLLATPAAVRFVSAEPLLGPVDLTQINRLDWVIAGGESGPGSRPMHPDWVRSLRDQCQAAGTAFFFKQWGDWLVGETRNGLPIPFQDGDEFHVISDGHDIILSTAYDEPSGPSHLWREYYGWQHHLVRRAGKGRAGRSLDGQTWDQMPARGGDQ